MRENEATLGRLQQQGVGIPSDERERERERERWSLLRAARDEADRSLSLAASLADKEAALSHAHATIKEVSPFFLQLFSLLPPYHFSLPLSQMLCLRCVCYFARRGIRLMNLIFFTVDVVGVFCKESAG